MTASSHWRQLVHSRLAEMEKLQPGRGSVGAGYWTTSRARSYAANVGGVDERDPLLNRLRSAVGSRTSVLDIGAGTGRYTLALAPRALDVTAVDPSPAMLGVLAKELRRREISNVHQLAGPWEEVAPAPADVALCSFVLPLIENAKSFLAKIDAATRRLAFVSLNAASADLLLEPLWRYFHGCSRRPSPTYLDAVAVLAEIGVAAEVEVVELPVRSTFATLGAAVRSYHDQLLLPDDPSVRRELRGLLDAWLVVERGIRRPPVQTWPTAILSWRPSPTGHTGRRR